MTAALDGPLAADPFGATVGERMWRRLAGAAVGVVAAAGVLLWTTELLPWVAIGALVVHVLGVPASWFLARRGRATVPGHALAAVVIAVPVAAVLAVPTFSFLFFWVVFTAVAVGTGAPLAALAAWAGTTLPDRWVRLLAVLGLVVTFVALPLGVWQHAVP